MYFSHYHQKLPCISIKSSCAQINVKFVSHFLALCFATAAPGPPSPPLHNPYCPKPPPACSHCYQRDDDDDNDDAEDSDDIGNNSGNDDNDTGNVIDNSNYEIRVCTILIKIQFVINEEDMMKIYQCLSKIMVSWGVTFR